MKRSIQTLFIAIIAITSTVTAEHTYTDLRLIDTLARVSKTPSLVFEPVPDKADSSGEFLVKLREEGNLKEYDLFAVDMNEEKSEIVRCCLGDGGYFTLVGQKAPLTVKVSTRFPGEHTRFYAVSTAFTKASTGMVTPRPVRTTQHGYTIQLECDSLLHEVFILEGSGFEPDELLHTTSRSGNEVIPGEGYQVGSDGKAFIVLAPATIGATGGQFQFTIRGKKGAVTISSPWGDEYSKTYSNRSGQEYVVFSKTPAS